MRVVLYVRTSTKDQNPKIQLDELRDYTHSRGFDIYREYIDVGFSGAQEKRPGLDQLMNDARKRRLDCVLVWKFDRFARSAKHLIQSLEEFHILGVEFISLSEPMDTTTPMGKMSFTVIAGVAELERELIRERVVVGLARAKRQGKRLGRPPTLCIAAVAAIRRGKEQGKTVKELAVEWEVSDQMVYRALQNSHRLGN